ncbi:MAG: hypothetical protein C5S45_05030 [Candidatus Methanocomedens sp.]|nr:MAG: hypothetical protein C5S45_05030 [ANME-2 cluster archaeon]
MDNGLLLVSSHRFSSDRGKLLENAVFLNLRRKGCEIYRLMDKKEVDFLIWKGTEPAGLINVCLDVSDASTKAREVDGLRRAMGHFGLGRGLVVTLNHSEIMDVDEGMIEFLPYRIWALQRMKGTQVKAPWSSVNSSLS